MKPIPLFDYQAQVERDKTLVNQGYPNYRPKTDEGRAYQQSKLPTTHTLVLHQKPNSTAGIGHD